MRRRYRKSNPGGLGTILAVAGGAAVLGAGYYYLVYAKVPAAGSITTAAQWAALNATQQGKYATQQGTTVAALSAGFGVAGALQAAPAAAAAAAAAAATPAATPATQ